MVTSTRPMTLEEFLALPETEPATELIDGYPCQKPVGKLRHARAILRLQVLLLQHPATASGLPLVELGSRYPATSAGNLRVPDLSFFLPGNDPGAEASYPARAPDLAVEVRSEGQALHPLEGRLSFLREQGTSSTLLIDPEAKTVFVHDGQRSWTASGNDVVTLEQHGGFSFPVGDLWK